MLLCLSFYLFIQSDIYSYIFVCNFDLLPRFVTFVLLIGATKCLK